MTSTYEPWINFISTRQFAYKVAPASDRIMKGKLPIL